jgi:hypothetical protein
MRHVSALGLSLLVPSLALASSLSPHTLEQRAERSDRVALVQVLSSEVIAEHGDPRRLKTLTHVVVGRDVKGQGAAALTIVQLGGERDGWSMHLPGDAQFSVGETALVFLRCSTESRCTLVGLGEGKLRLAGDGVVVHDLFTDKVSTEPLERLEARLKGVTTPAAAAPTPSVKGAHR